jgi:hypothetical protein
MMECWSVGAMRYVRIASRLAGLGCRSGQITSVTANDRAGSQRPGHFTFCRLPQRASRLFKGGSCKHLQASRSGGADDAECDALPFAPSLHRSNTPSLRSAYFDPAAIRADCAFA